MFFCRLVFGICIKVFDGHLVLLRKLIFWWILHKVYNRKPDLRCVKRSVRSDATFDECHLITKTVVELLHLHLSIVKRYWWYHLRQYLSSIVSFLKLNVCVMSLVSCLSFRTCFRQPPTDGEGSSQSHRRWPQREQLPVYQREVCHYQEHRGNFPSLSNSYSTNVIVMLG